jgi:hypothetical protein
MNRTEFERRLLLYGGRLERWPPEEARAAQLLASRDPEAQELLDEARRLDAVVAEALAADPAGSALTGQNALTGQILAHVGRATRWRGFARSDWRLAGAGAALAAAAVAGFAAGFFAGGLPPAIDDAMLMSMAGGADIGVWLLL